MLIKKPSDIKSSEITDYAVWKQRRQFLKQAAALGIGAGLSGMPLSLSAASQGYGNKPITALKKTDIGQDLEPTAYGHVTSYNNFYELGTGKGDPVKNASSLRTRPWVIRVEGECEKPGEIGIEDILSGFTQEERIYRFRCVEAWGMVVPWVGFPSAIY